MTKLSAVLIFFGVAFCVQRSFSIEQCDSGGYCPPSFDESDYNECCRYFKDSCCTHEENERLKKIFIVVVVVSGLSFIALIACIVGIIACCCCALCKATTPETTRRTVINTGYAPVPSNVY